ncbi:MAG: beta-N-acetylhexosaminidase [Armatimonadetes bacterium]|nr:beta-N-acetylhexosaminidase [Armatimonadota bacterium]
MAEFRRRRVDHLTPRQRVGQLFMVDFEGPEPTAEVERLIAAGEVGGVVLFAKNIVTPLQVAGLVNALQKTALDHGQPPLLVAIDQEGGIVSRLRGGATIFPGAMALGAAHSEHLAYAVGRAMATELRAVGVTCDFAPVLDVNSNPANPIIGIRSFGEDPDLVARLGIAMGRGLQDHGVLATGKHFPGHGDTSVDSHLDLPVVPHPADRLEAVELLPFRRAAAAGLQAIMTAHVAFPALDASGVPASLSPAVGVDLLRQKWGYDGLVVTDSLLMQAVADRYAPADLVLRALRAGSDILLALGPSARQREMIDAVMRAAERGEISEDAVARAARRVLWAKERYGIFRWPQVEPDRVAAQVGIADHASVSRAVAEAAVTLVRDQDRLLPLRGPVSVISCVPPEAEGHTVGAALARLGLPVREERLGLAPAPGDCQKALDLAAWADVAVVVTFGWPAPSAAQADLVKALRRQLSGRVIVIATGTPYDLSGFPEAGTYACTYSPDPASIEAAARLLAGRLAPRGRLPVIPTW